jgi:DNA-binding NtrC family response regulator
MHRLETEQRMSWRILVINDDQSILDMFPLILEAERHEVLLSQEAITMDETASRATLRKSDVSFS